MEFKIEYVPHSTVAHWWAMTEIDEYGNVAIGGGDTVWEAIGECLLDIPHTLENLEKWREMMREFTRDRWN